MKQFLALALLATFDLRAGAEIIDLKPRHVVMPVDTNSTETQGLKIVAERIPNPEEIFEFQNDNETQTDFASKPGVQKPGLHISNGNMATRGQFPWQVAVIVDDSLLCGGSLISSIWVLTAAHCTGSSYKLILGTTRIDRKETGSRTVRSRRSIVHPKYVASTLKNDIALIQLPRAVKFSDYIKLVNLPRRFEENNSFVGKRVRVSGWGRYSDSVDQFSTHLQYADVIVIDNTECAKAFGTFVTSTNLCVSTNGGQSTCNGDSGGPLVLTRNDVNTQVGIVSFGAEIGCERGYPAAFTRVTSYLSWIQSVTGIPIF